MCLKTSSVAFQHLYSTAVFGSLGGAGIALGTAYLSHAIDESRKRSLDAFEDIRRSLDHRLSRLEEALHTRGRKQKKLEFRARVEIQ